MRPISDFVADVWANVIGGQPRQDWMVAGVAWFGAESGWGSRGAANNPFNTTQKMPGTTPFNSLVPNYPTYAEGLQATTTTLHYAAYRQILIAMRSGTDEQIAAAIHASEWGTEDFGASGNRLVGQVRARYPYYAAIGIPGSVIEPVPTGGSTVQPEFNPAISIVSMCIFIHPTLGAAAAAVAADGAIFCAPANAYLGGANGKQFFVGRVAALVSPATDGYYITDTENETYIFPTNAQ